jgi:hypothetical protein
MKIPYSYLLLGPGALFALGFVLNAVVMAANHGQMPVLIPGGIADGCPLDPQDFLHSCMTSATHLKIIADWVVAKSLGVASPGDFFLWAGDSSFWPALTAWIALMLKGNR